MEDKSRATWEIAFRQTTYRADTPDGAVDIRIGEVPAGLPLACWAFLTAFNPLPLQLTEVQNQARHQELVGVLEEVGLSFYPGEGRGDSGSWPPERSVLILGISREDALALAVRFGQVAFVYGEPNQQSELVWTGL
jgi:hypothetical protein